MHSRAVPGHGVDYESLAAAGSIMGSGGMIVMDETACMVDVAKFFMDFCTIESCGKCVPCRVGTTQMHGLLERISEGKAAMEDLDTAGDAWATWSNAQPCADWARPRPTRCSARCEYFRDEYVQHIEDKTCAQGKCPCSRTPAGTAEK